MTAGIVAVAVSLVDCGALVQQIETIIRIIINCVCVGVYVSNQ
jgi:hypothetical protein